MRRAAGFAAACVIYGAAAAALFYRPGLLDGTGYLGNGPDPFLYIWMFKFLPAAIAHGQNPFILPQAWAPYGLNITQATTTPFLALAAWPLTALAGPVVAFNLVTLAIPALAAAAAFLLMMALTEKWLPAFAGGWIFGFSTAVFGPLMGHLQTDFVLLIPLVFLILVLRLQGRISLGRGVAALSVLGVCQFLTSLETFVTSAIFVLVFAGVAQACKPGGWRNLAARRDNLLLAVALGFMVTVLLVSPFIYYFFIDYAEIPHLLQNGSYYATDVLNLIVPTNVTLLGGAAARPVSLHFAGNSSEQLGYIGLPLVVITVVAARKIWPFEIGKPVVVTMLAALVFSLGPKLKILGHGLLPLPWEVMQRLPLLGNALPSRLMIFAVLFLAMACAMWLARPGRFYRFGLVAAAAALMIPASRSPHCYTCWYSTLPQSAFFQSGAFKTQIPPGQIFLFIPFAVNNGAAMLWQAQTDGYFRMVNGYGNFIPPALSIWPAADILQSKARPAPAGQLFTNAFKQFMKANGARDVIVPAANQPAWDGFLQAAGWTGQSEGDVSLYETSDAAWAAIRVTDPAVARLDFDQAHLAALRQAAVCLLRKNAAISTETALAAHCLDAAYGAAPDDPAGNWDAMSGWLGNLNGAAAVGIMADGAEAANIIAASPAGVEKIYYSYPRLYDPRRRITAARAQLIFAYDPAMLR